MSLSLLRRIASELRRWPADHSVEHPTIRLTGGEPFLYPYLEDVFSLFSFAPRIEITTNGTAITELHLNRMSGQKVALNVSVYMDKSGNRIAATSKLHNILASGVPTTCVLVAHSQNLTTLPRVLDELEQMGAKLIVIVCVKPRRDKTGDSIEHLLLRSGDVRNLREMIERRKHSGASYILKEPTTCKRLNAQDSAVPGCVCATGHLSILTDGHVTPCNSLLDVAVGNCVHDSLFDLYNAPGMRFVRKMSKLSIDDLEPCRSCRFNQTCCAGSRIDSYLQTGDWLAVDPDAPCAGRVSRLAFLDPSLAALQQTPSGR